MKIILAEHYGVCFGVRDALAEAERLARVGPVTILGELVHNPLVRERLRAAGVQETPLTALGTAATAQVMITAHGASETARQAWRTAGYTVADGTCPLVRHAHEQLRLLVADRYFPVIIGQSGHAEVEGLRGDFPGAFVFLRAEELAALPPAARYGVISQTTQPIGLVHGLVSTLRRQAGAAEVRFCDTVCQPTKKRQLALQKLVAEADTVIVVGGHGSNNTRQLAETARLAGRTAWHVENAAALRPEMVAGARVVGVTAGTSTLRETVAEVVARLREFAPAGR